MTCGDRADVDLDRRRELLAHYGLDGLAEHIELRKLECFPAIVRILVLQPVFPLLAVTRILEKGEQQILDRLREMPKINVCGQSRQTRCRSDASATRLPTTPFLVREGHLSE